MTRNQRSATTPLPEDGGAQQAQRERHVRRKRNGKREAVMNRVGEDAVGDLDVDPVDE